MSKLKLPTKVQNEFRDLKEEFPVIETGLKRKLTEEIESETENLKPSKTPKNEKSLNKKENLNILSKAKQTTGAPKTAPVTSKSIKSGVKPEVKSTKPVKPVIQTKSTTTAKPGTSAATAKPKRSQWDTKGRLEDMEKLADDLKGELKHAKENYDELKNEIKLNNEHFYGLEELKKELLESMNAHAKNISNDSDIVETLKNLVVEKEEQFKEEKSSLMSKFNSEKESLEKKIKGLENEREDLAERLRQTKKTISALEETMSVQAASELALKSKIGALEISLDNIRAELSQEKKFRVSVESELENSRALIENLEQKIREEEQLRRVLHNTIQELKGNVRVFCRVRPILPDEGGNDSDHLKYPDAEGKKIQICQVGENVEGKSRVKDYEFSFDKVFIPESTQEDVFNEISQLVQSACDGYNVCIFAYGQTNSGKTYTMEGTEDNKGMIPRSAQLIWEESMRLKEKGWTYTMEGSFVEIYNENIRDLLSKSSSEKLLELKTDKKRATVISGATVERLDSPEQVMELLKVASENRSVAETQCNERSSRSHSVFMMKISGYNQDSGEKCEGILNLIDLAGSERLNNSQATGDRLKETQNINKSLSALSTVFTSLANKEEHIPYRNSKLTRLLQNSLGGNSKTLMFVNISPSITNIQETLCSLRFATKVNNCQIGTATKNVR